MKDKNRHSQPFIIVFSVAVVLAILSNFNTEFHLFGFYTKQIEPFSAIMSAGKYRLVPLPSKVVNDSIISKDVGDYAIRKIDSSNIYDFEYDSTSALAHFFQSLNETQKHKHKTRIAYFGDSMIEGDLISQDLRACLQDKFGGDGVGYVPITSIVSGFRTSVVHSFDGWTTHHLLENRANDYEVGISGYSFIPSIIGTMDKHDTITESWVNYAGVNKKHLNKFYTTKLLYGKSGGENYVAINGSSYKLSDTKEVNQLVINNGKAYSYIHAKFQCKSSMAIFGISFESDSGVFVDNFSFRGNSGLPIQKVAPVIYSQTNDCLGYDLIVLEYGLNAVDPAITDFSWYEHGMNSVIKHIQTSFPKASILLISVGDKSYRKNGVYQTDPSVPILVKTQKKMAKDNKVAFWSLYDAMGGIGSMVKWVEGDTVFANKDYTHFNFKGAQKVGKLLYSKLISEYNDYNKKHK